MATRKSAQGAQAQGMEQMMAQMMQMMEQMQARMTALESTQAQAKASTGKAQPKAEDEKVPYTKLDGTVIMVTQKQYDNYMRLAEGAKNRTPEQQKVIDDIKAAKAREPELTRKLEKALGIKANSLKNTACTAEQCRALGWKGTRRELKAIKAQVRASK